MVGNKSKKLKVEENFKHNINEELVLSFEKFQEVQDKLEKINEKQCVKFLKIAQKYNEKRKPVYDMRNEITKLIPYFWLTAFMSHPVLYDILNYEDRKMFKYMHSLEVEDNKDVNSDYKINFNFNPNPYFENTKLTKAFTILEDGTKKITASPIKWKEGKGIRSGVDHDKKRNKRFDSSFFRWFSDCKQKDDMHDIHDEVAELIKNELWPNPLSSFNNEDDEEDVDDEENDVDDIKDEEEENKDENENEDEDEDSDEEMEEEEKEKGEKNNNIN